MNAIPARVAGVERIVMVTPPGRDGEPNPTVLAAAHLAGVREVYRVGGAQAIAALPLEQREAIVLRIWGGLTFAEAARTLDENINTVAARYRAALAKLRHLLPEACHEPD
jgi:histidinol dehydrogenase